MPTPNPSCPQCHGTGKTFIVKSCACHKSREERVEVPCWLCYPIFDHPTMNKQDDFSSEHMRNCRWAELCFFVGWATGLLAGIYIR